MAISKNKPGFDNPQASLFGASTTEIPGSLDRDHVVRSTISQVLRVSKKSRVQIAEEMSFSVGRPVSEDMLNAYTAESHNNHRFPAAWIPAFCAVTGDDRLLLALVAGTRLQRKLDLADAFLQKEMTDRQFHRALAVFGVSPHEEER